MKIPGWDDYSEYEWRMDEPEFFEEREEEEDDDYLFNNNTLSTSKWISLKIPARPKEEK